MTRGAAVCLALLLFALIPSLALAAGDLVEHRAIHISNDYEFTVENGVVSGCGTSQSPYVIEGWHIVPQGDGVGITVNNTTLCLVIRSCIIEGASDAAILLDRVSNGRIEGCQLIGNEQGILLEDSHDNALIGNLIAENHYGVVMTIGSKDNIATQNSFIWNPPLTSKDDL